MYAIHLQMQHLHLQIYHMQVKLPGVETACKKGRCGGTNARCGCQLTPVETAFRAAMRRFARR
jgi:hypothetical protein